ncbi:hypothetical protein HMPREF9130_0550 [Peptoniphilus sp. oral taxon 375 str. F0436]|nr:hypothetical protein HMPREF9130_0550 [Peptoniphilus sp. oral taxon 375 str. F0436]
MEKICYNRKTINSTREKGRKTCLGNGPYFMAYKESIKLGLTS